LRRRRKESQILDKLDRLILNDQQIRRKKANFYKKVMVSFVVLISIGLFLWFRFSPDQPPLNLSFKAPLSLEKPDSTGAQIETIIQSKRTDVFAQDSIQFTFRVFDIQESYFRSKLENRKLGFRIYGTGEGISLTYSHSKNEYHEQGTVIYPFPGDYPIDFVYYPDAISSGIVLKRFGLRVHVLPYYEKGALRLNMTLCQLTKVILIFTFVILWCSFIMIFR